MEIRIVYIGSKQSKLLDDALSHYTTSINFYWKTNVVGITPTKISDTTVAIQKEGREILAILHETDFVIALDSTGMSMSSNEFSLYLSKKIESNKRVVFIIGGSYGLSSNIKERANLIFSMSNMTFPHEIARMLLLEQIYRASMIKQNKPYHH